WLGARTAGAWAAPPPPPGASGHGARRRATTGAGGPPVVSSRHVPRRLEPEPTHTAIQVRAVCGELAGRVGHVAARRRQGAGDERALEAVQGLRERYVAPALARRGGGSRPV